MSVQRKKQYEVMKKSKRSKDIKGIITPKRRMKFSKDGAFITSDAGEAHDILEKYPDDVIVSEIDSSDPAAENRGGFRSRRVFSVGQMPWKKKK